VANDVQIKDQARLSSRAEIDERVSTHGLRFVTSLML